MCDKNLEFVYDDIITSPCRCTGGCAQYCDWDNVVETNYQTIYDHMLTTIIYPSKPAV